MTDLDKAQAVLASATPGRWVARLPGGATEGCRSIAVKSAGHRQAQYVVHAFTTGLRDDAEDAANAAAIVLAVNIAPSLLSLLEACVRPAGPADRHRECRICGETMLHLVHADGCPVPAAESAIAAALPRGER